MHSLPAQVEQSAAKRGIAPKLLADENSAAFRTVMDTMGISFDDFIRTTDDYHERQVQAFVTKCENLSPQRCGSTHNSRSASRQSPLCLPATFLNTFTPPHAQAQG